MKSCSPLAGTDVRTDDNMLGRPIGAQQKYFEWIAEIIMIDLIIPDAEEPYGGFGCHKEV